MVTTNVSSRSPRSIEEITGSGASPSPRQSASPFTKGSVVSLRMKNFLVYKDVIASFGPRLNVVVGPNGSGKSTLVCAIALGLGGNTKMLGRADHLSAFVMHGVKDDASVTVELFMPQGDNLKVTRTFSRRNNSSNWHVNGRSMSDKQVKEKVAGLGIQVDNLCTMLPQDKVGDFSGFSPDKLLIETMKALSPNQLYQPHLQLIELQDSSGKNLLEEETTTTKLEGMKSELDQLENDVQRYEERQEKEEKRLLHTQRKLWLRAEALAERGGQLKKDHKEAQKELNEAKEADAPLQRECDKFEREVTRVRGALAKRTGKGDKLKKATEDACLKVEKMQAKADTQRGEIQNVETRRRAKEEKLAKTINDLGVSKEKLEGAREQSAESPCVDDVLAQVNATQAAILAKKGDLKDQIDIYKNAQFGMRAAEDSIKKLTNLKAVKEQKFKQNFRGDGDIAMKVRDWASRNADKLRGPVTGPIGLEVTVDDPEAATAVETHVAKYIWCSLVVDCKEDHDTIIRAFSNEKRSISVLVNQGGGLKQRHAMFSGGEMARLQETAGVRGFLDAFITCPDTIRQTLRRNCKIDRTFLGSAITQRKISSDPTFLPSLGKPVNGHPTGSTIYAGGEHGASQGVAAEPLQVYMTKISLYGQRKPSVRVSETRPALVVGRGVDADAVQEQEEARENHDRILKAAVEKRKKITDIIKQLEKEEQHFMNEYKNVGQIKNTEKRLERIVKRTENAIRTLQTELGEDGEAERVNRINRLEQILIQHAASVAQAQELLGSMIDTSVEQVAASLAKRAAEDKLAEAREELNLAQESRMELEAKVKELNKGMAKVRTEFQAERKNALQKAPKFFGNDQQHLTPFGEVFDDLPNNVDELDAVIEDLNEDLDQSEDNPEVMQKYEKLKKEVETVAKALSELKDRNANSAAHIESISVPWVERLQNVVDKLHTLFGEYMSKMDGCVGEVVLAKDKSYKRWGVEIRVRFRSEADEGKMAVLNKLVHSGGERSVSTILYLMALQDLQCSPFRVVDEINQGMDPKNERGVFSRIVLNSCGASRKQYFLITPKLLQGLVAMDNDDVTLIVIFNGKNTCNGTGEHTMRNFINAKKRQLAQQAGRGDGGPRKQLRTIH